MNNSERIFRIFNEILNHATSYLKPEYKHLSDQYMELSIISEKIFIIRSGKSLGYLTLKKIYEISEIENLYFEIYSKPGVYKECFLKGVIDYNTITHTEIKFVFNG